MSVLVVGSVAIDDITTPTLHKPNLLGGSASYASVSASFYVPTRLVGVVGKDFPQEHRKKFENRKIDLDGLEVADGKTFFWAGEYEKNMNNRRTLTVELNVFEKFSPKLPESYKYTPYVLLANIGPEQQLQVLDQVANPQFVIADTMDFYIQNARPKLMELLKRINLLILNDSEALELSGEPNIVRAAKWLRSQGPKYVAVKKGEHGCYFVGDEGVFISPAVPLEGVSDPTGAGDTFVGALAGYIASTNDTSFENLKKGIIEGTVMASFTVEDFSLDRLIRLEEEERKKRRALLKTITTF